MHEAILLLEIQTAGRPLQYADVTVRHSVPGDAGRLRQAAATPGKVAADAESEKRACYGPDAPLATDMFGRHGEAVTRRLRDLARQAVGGPVR